MADPTGSTLTPFRGLDGLNQIAYGETNAPCISHGVSASSLFRIVFYGSSALVLNAHCFKCVGHVPNSSCNEPFVHATIPIDDPLSPVPVTL